MFKPFLTHLTTLLRLTLSVYSYIFSRCYQAEFLEFLFHVRSVNSTQRLGEYHEL